MTCPQCHANNPVAARFCMTCGTALPTAANDAPTALPHDAFTPPSEAARQTGGLAAAPLTPPSGYTRSTHPIAQSTSHSDSQSASFTPTSGYTPPTSPPTTPPQAGAHSQAAMWMAQAQTQPGYYYPPAPATLPELEQRSNFGLYIGAAVVAIVVMAAAAWLLLAAGNGSNNTGNGSNNGAAVSGTPDNSATPGDTGKPTPSNDNLPLASACTSSIPTPTGGEEQAVIQAIQSSNNDQIEALKNLDTEVLKHNRVGDEYQKQLQDVQDMKAKGFYYEAKLECIDYVKVTVDGNAATASTVERWSGSLFDQKTKRKLTSQPPTLLHETYTLEKQGDKWLVGKVDIAEEQIGTPDDGSQ